MQSTPFHIALELQDDYTFALRPLQLDGNTLIVSRFTAQYPTPGGRAFFEFLTTSEGFDLLEPDNEYAKMMTRETSIPYGSPSS